LKVTIKGSCVCVCPCGASVGWIMRNLS